MNRILNDIDRFYQEQIGNGKDWFGVPLYLYYLYRDWLEEAVVPHCSYWIIGSDWTASYSGKQVVAFHTELSGDMQHLRRCFDLPTVIHKVR